MTYVGSTKFSTSSLFLLLYSSSIEPPRGRMQFALGGLLDKPSLHIRHPFAPPPGMMLAFFVILSRLYIPGIGFGISTARRFSYKQLRIMPVHYCLYYSIYPGTWLCMIQTAAAYEYSLRVPAYGCLLSAVYLRSRYILLTGEYRIVLNSY